jgi:hypothetical protein
MQTSHIFLLLLSLAIFSCTVNDQKQYSKSDAGISSSDTTLKGDTVQRELATRFSNSETDTLTIDKKAAVFYQPDSLQIDKRMKQTGEADFRAGADDYMYYIHISVDYLEKQGLPVMDSKNKKYLRFVMADNKEKLVRLDTLQDLWGLYLFDPKKNPYNADIIQIEEEYKIYYR